MKFNDELYKTRRIIYPHSYRENPAERGVFW